MTFETAIGWWSASTHWIGSALAKPVPAWFPVLIALGGLGLRIFERRQDRIEKAKLQAQIDADSTADKARSRLRDAAIAYMYEPTQLFAHYETSKSQGVPYEEAVTIMITAMMSKDKTANYAKARLIAAKIIEAPPAVPPGQNAQTLRKAFLPGFGHGRGRGSYMDRF